MLMFDITGVVGVFLGEDFITITASESTDWAELRPAVLGRLMDHFTARMPVLFEEAAASENTFTGEEVFDEADADIVQEIKELL